MNQQYYGGSEAAKAASDFIVNPMRRLKRYLRRNRLLTRRGRKRSSLVRRFQLLLLAWGIVIYLIAVAGFWFTTNSVIQSTFEQQAREWMARVAHITTPLFLQATETSYADIEQYLKNYAEISYVKFYRAGDGAPLAQFLRPDVSELALPVFDPAVFEAYSVPELEQGKATVSYLQHEDNLLRLVAPVSVVAAGYDNLLRDKTDEGRGNVVGYIDMGVNLTSYRQRLAEHVLAGSILISFLFLIAAVIGRQLITNALKPLLDLQEPLQRLANGETDVWVSRQGDEEIVAISRALNSTISAIKGRDQALRRLADYDALTGLINKRSFSILLEEERQRVIENDDSSALFFIDLDQFKYINDTLGHSAGDRLLIQIAQLLKSRLRSDDVISRLGGDEFSILAKSVDRAGAIEIAGIIVKSMYDFLFVEQGKTFNIYCSIGAAMIENDHYSPDDIFSHADMACYTAKAQGRNRYKFFEPQAGDNNKVDIGWSHRIAHALANDRFILHYQPIIGFSDDTPGFEVLLRMKGEEDEIIPPNRFIPIAERFGLATEIDYWVIKNSMKVLERFNQMGKRARFYVNLSGQLLVDPEFVPRVLAMLGDFNVEPEQIVFELTERAAVGNIHKASEKMQTLRKHGFLFAVDDFGSGFSSFSYLKHMPVEFVKIEGEFVERIIDDEVDRALVKSMVDIAKACGKKVVAEFVCDQKTLDMLKTFGIDYAQGFFIATPASQPAFHKFTGRAWQPEGE